MNGVIYKNKKIHPADDYDQIQKFIGMQRLVDLSSNEVCEDRCTNLYNRFVDQYGPNNQGLSSKMMGTLENFLLKLQNLKGGGEQAKKIQLMSTFALSLLKCAKEDPETCPYQDKIL